MFVGRKKELAALERRFRSNVFECFIVYGRRRVGKSTLLKEFLKNKKSIYFTSVEGGLQANLQNLSNAIHFALGEPSGAVFPSYQDAFEYVFQKSQDQRLVMVFDEYPYAARTDASLPSTLQLLIDQHQESSKLMLILCGSSVSFMEDEVLAYRSPLYGRRTGQLRIEPFDFFDSRAFFVSEDPVHQALIYGAVGGTPLYLQKLSGSAPLKDKFESTWFSLGSFFFDEPINFLKQEVRSPTVYFDVLKALAEGASKLNDISQKTNKENNSVLHALDLLISLGIVEKELPYNESSSRRGIYRISDNMYRFWFAILNPNAALILNNGGDIIWNRIQPIIPNYMGSIFEDICKQYLLRQLVQGKLPLIFSSIGRWWGNDPLNKTEVEIDLVAEQDRDNAIFAECKWTNEKVDAKILDKLDDLSRRLFHYQNRHLYIFSKSGFTDGCVERAKSFPSVHLVSFEEMTRADA